MRAAFAEFRATTDPLAVWLDLNTVDVMDGFVLKHELRTLYMQDCRDNGRLTLSESQFTGRLMKLRRGVRSVQHRIGGKQKECFAGIGLRAEQDVPQGVLPVF
jgi:hypothetical protein